MSKILNISKNIKSFRRASAVAAATCGELAQGFLNGHDFLINSPINYFAEVEVEVKKTGGITLSCNSYSKVKGILNALKHRFNLSELGLHVIIQSNIPRGKGMASSTAELTAAILACANALNIALTDEEIVSLLLEIDGSSDGVFLPGVTQCNHLNGDVHAYFGLPPALAFIIVDTGGEVSTKGFDRKRARQIALQHQNTLYNAVRLIGEGFEKQNAALIAQGATLSAEVNQHVLYKEPFQDLLQGTKELGALGVNCAHTGTVLGVMFDPLTTNADKLVQRIEKLVPELPILGVYHLISGGREQLEKKIA